MKPRVKVGHVSGDVSMAVLIAMLEKRWPERARARSLRRMVRLRERATLKRQARAEMEEALLASG